MKIILVAINFIFIKFTRQVTSSEVQWIIFPSRRYLFFVHNDSHIIVKKSIIFDKNGMHLFLQNKKYTFCIDYET